MEAAAGRYRGEARDVAALTHALYTRYGQQILAYCLHRLGSREEAEDAVQTTFMNVFRTLQRGTVPQAEQAWLYAIAKNVCVARRAAAGRRLRVEAPNDLEVLQEVVPAPVRGRREELIGLEEVLEAMPANQRRAILLREWQGLSYREIGAELGLSQASVEMLIFRARRALARGLERTPAQRPAEAPPRQAGRRFDVGAVLGAVKSLLTGSALLKVAVVAFAAGTATGAIGEPAQKTIVRQPRRPVVTRIEPRAEAALLALRPRGGSPAPRGGGLRGTAARR